MNERMLAIFDVNGTLLDPAAIDSVLGLAGGNGIAVDALDDAIAQSMTDALAGAYRPFPDYLEAALRRRLELGGRGEDRLGAALEAATQLPAFGDAGEALTLLRDAGFRLAALTNSARDGAARALRHAGLLAMFDDLTGSDELRTYKPAPQMYRLAMAKAGASPAETWMVAAHGWDLLGAKQQDLRTGWVSRKERVLLATVPAPDASGATLLEVAEQIASLTDCR